MTDESTKVEAGAAPFRLQPLGPRVLVRLDDAVDRTKGGIYIPDAAQKAPGYGVVLAAGEWQKDYPEIDIAVGDRVLVNKYGGQAIRYDDEELLVLHVYNDVLARELSDEDLVAMTEEEANTEAVEEIHAASRKACAVLEIGKERLIRTLGPGGAASAGIAVLDAEVERVKTADKAEAP